jgi:P27 family predicted phage terminase small subunit
MGEVAAAFYRKYGPVLAQLGVLTTADEPMFKLMAQHVELAQRAYDELNNLVPLFDAEGKPILDADGNQIKARAGLTLESKDGRKKNPLTQIFRDNSLAARQFATEFGMTPAARSKLHTEAEGQMTIEDILFGTSVAVGTDVETSDV